jgi:hypothetical protein
MSTVKLAGGSVVMVAGLKETVVPFESAGWIGINAIMDSSNIATITILFMFIPIPP